MANVNVKRKTRRRLSHCFGQSEDLYVTTNVIINQEITYNEDNGIINFTWKLDHPSPKLMEFIKKIRLIEQIYYDYVTEDFRGSKFYEVKNISCSKYGNFDLVEMDTDRWGTYDTKFKVPPPYENGGFDYSVYDPWNRGIE